MYMGSGARLWISKYAGLAEVGLFMLAFRLAGVMSTAIWRPFHQAWAPQQFKLVGSDEGMSIYSRGFLIVSVMLVSAGVALAYFSPKIAKLMSAKAFSGVGTIVPVLALQNVITVATRFSRFGLLVEGRTRAFLAPTIVSALAATAVAFILAKPLGAIGVAWALVCQALLNLWLIECKDLSAFDVRLPWGKFWTMVAAGIVAYLLSTFGPTDLWASIAFKLVVFTIFVFGVIFSPIVGRRERKALVRLAWDAISKTGRLARV